MENIWLTFCFNTLNTPFHCILTFIISTHHHCFLVLLSNFSGSGFQQFGTSVFKCRSFFFNPAWNLLSFVDLLVFSYVWCFQPSFLQIFFLPLFSLGIPLYILSKCLTLSYRFLQFGVLSDCSLYSDQIITYQSIFRFTDFSTMSDWLQSIFFF